MWKINDYCNDKKGYIRLTDDDGKTVCDIFPFGAVGGIGLDKARENARKIANTEQLWDALRGLLDWVEEGCPDGGRYATTEASAALKMIRLEPTQLCPGGIEPGFEDCPKCGATDEDDCRGAPALSNGDR